MKVTICAVGRMRSGPEADLVRDYITRFDRAGRPLGLGPLSLVEVEDRKGGGQSAEAALLARALPQGARLCALDERGERFDSPGLAAQLARWRDDGRGDLAFVIGGADGLAPDLRARADAMLSFGAMVWPHMLARVMLTEQLYRATQILAGTPYHRA
ncbi:23S rRNA (pseudouridine(1915)-N(3))-methyltransferase RlmH [Phaeovulum vinaykumarii]|uniref:Ribosomal RNA large subunit methyltransferase H n=1 Tax=Phaeovulum vinaykumarii TaxID=407234 RepID=A0A1N7KR52_9RHOB|nr:23S rRNA (pseudouridine(1915)-N(3))-methyltransferase RlmH [Phaeovulum vinaykumarii]SIS64044.1 23S rRNA (pseudouridine1915-N3)-methyltransferase [Phaeovulum vinaykumarii]SOC01692.1 23S rRNA (pseudouridine1915-N3)-methyltransferase [Phaeovulum vinaykumarii]